MSNRHRLLKAFRLTHLYLGVFITPALIFFAFTGFVQTFSLHETTRGSNYKPPAILAKLGQLHKKQTLVLPVRRPQPASTPGTPATAATATTPQATADVTQEDGEGKRRRNADTPKPDAAKPDMAAAAVSAPKSADTPPPAKAKNLLPMKLFFALVSIGLLISSVTGLYMSYKYVRSAALITALWVAGIVVPVLLTFF